MDKQKQIEEMEKDIAFRMTMAKVVVGSMNNGVEGWLSEYLYNAGYRKIPENAVVLTREELEERDCKNHHEGHKTGVAGMQEQVEALNTLYKQLMIENATLNTKLMDYEKGVKTITFPKYEGVEVE